MSVLLTSFHQKQRPFRGWLIAVPTADFISKVVFEQTVFVYQFS